MSSEKIVVSFVYEEGYNFVLVVPDMGNEMMVRAKTQSEVIRKAIRSLRERYKETIVNLKPSPIDIFTEDYKEKRGIPKHSILYPLPIKVGKRKKVFKRFTSSMDESILDEIENFTKNKKIKKSDFFTQASLEYIQKYDSQNLK
ncbi:MAG: Unknown protein [uncultured Sulfurovum sp.]|uniref:HicB-like antitoxin of toxin-antitoxin system domain-containing protein n=1 Tax=uncultured Sulfurovum sp. TaxID=269237 RepID=A0A6S6T4Y2_9BACT|nr:MAG: Unknown protein [uncultured Sulfurovum sp.]